MRYVLVISFVLGSVCFGEEPDGAGNQPAAGEAKQDDDAPAIETIVLKSGKTLEGTITRRGKQFIDLHQPGMTWSIAVSDIERIETAEATAEKNKGKVYFNGKWFTPAEKEAEEKEAAAIEEYVQERLAVKTKEQEESRQRARQYAEKMRAEGKVLDNGRWLTPEEKQEVIEKRKAALAAQSAAQERAAALQPTDITWAEYMRACGVKAQDQNEARAAKAFREKYEGKIVKWAGIVEHVEEPRFGGGGSFVNIKMQPSDESLIADLLLIVPANVSVMALNKGEPVKFIARIVRQGGPFSVHSLRYLGQ
ncbi:MAG: hypothetical protein NTW87_13635 [Planctomycetota bacterium]|nr:hypothetical protein [Planctomycetota bacterium]